MRPASADRKVGALPSTLLVFVASHCASNGALPSILLVFFLSPKKLINFFFKNQLAAWIPEA